MVLAAINDAAELASFAADYTLSRCRHPIADRRNNGIGDYLDKLQTFGHAIYEGVLVGTLSRNAGITAYLPLCEARVRAVGRGYLADDLEIVAALAITKLFNNLPTGIEKFPGLVTKVIDAAIVDELRRERRAERFAREAADASDAAGGQRLDADAFADPKSADRFAAIDTADEVMAVALDEIDRRIVEMRAADKNDREIGEAIGLSTSAVNLRRRKLAARYEQLQTLGA